MGVRGSEWVRRQCLGSGSTATVYLATSTVSGERQGCFAVKSAALSRSAALRREHKILSSLCSPNVVSCLGSDVTTEPDGRVLYNLFLEYVPGGSLADAIKQQGALEERAIRLYTRGILEGLAYLHGRGIVHCDVKGHNVLVGKDDGMSVKLADFGCARLVDDGSDGRGVISGTPLYMAPEVARGEEQGPAADLWALGCTVIEMATGCPPWRDVADPVAAVHRIAFSTDVPELPCNVSDDAREFLGRCLSRDPAKRWSAEELLNHPFVDSNMEFAKGGISDSKGNSPKSTLDQEYWDSLPEEEDDDDDGGRGKGAKAKPHLGNHPLGSPRERLRKRLGVHASPAPGSVSTWDEDCWILVRNGVLSEDQQPSTSGSYSAEEPDGPVAVAGVGGSACYGDGSAASSSVEGCSPSNSSPVNCYLRNDVTNHPRVVSSPHEGHALADAHKLINDFTKQERLTDYYDYDHVVMDLTWILQRN